MIKPFYFQQWHAWGVFFGAISSVLLSDDSNDVLRAFANPRDCADWLYKNGHVEAAKSFDNHTKETQNV